MSSQETRVHQQPNARIGDFGNAKRRPENATSRTEKGVYEFDGDVAIAPVGVQKSRNYRKSRTKSQQ